MAFVTVDKAGRLVLPKAIRDEFDTNTFEVKAEKNKIVFKPKEGLKSLFGKYPQIDMAKFRKQHEEDAENEHFA